MLLLLALAAPAAEEPEPVALDPAPRLVPLDAPWHPPLPDPLARDWLLLTSGEWLSGEIELILDEVVYFDSVELDDLEIDWEDVAGLRSARANTYRFGPTILTGTAAMHEGLIRVDDGSEVVEFPRGALLSMIPGELRELNYWSLGASTGLTLRSGNSDQRDLSTLLEIKRETPLTRFLLSYQNSYSVVEDEEITNNQRLAAQLAVYATARFFVLVPFAELFRDRIQNIDLRATVGSGVGYDVIDRPRAEWSVVLGGAYQSTHFDDTAASEARSDDAAVVFNTSLELEPLKDLDWDTTYKLQLIVTDFDKTNHHLTSVLSIDVWGPLDFDLTFAWDRIESPEPSANGEVPERNDFRLTAGLGIDL